jgi:diketogulonate reductase-like aldo/keto reductase
MSHGPSSLAERIEIAPGVAMPRLGLGTFRAHGAVLEDAIVKAFELGYRLVDTSPIYFNERVVGRAIARSGVPRDELLVTTKLDSPSQGFGPVRYALHRSLRRLGLDYVDLYLVHWPPPRMAKSHLMRTTWRAMEEAQRSGLVRAIGVSNYEVADLEMLLAMTEVPPAVNQVKLNPLVQRQELQRYCFERGIRLEAWEPIMLGRASDSPLLAELARLHSKTAEQVSLRWLLQKEIVAIPKTVHEKWLRENADVFGFELTAGEMQQIDALGE